MHLILPRSHQNQAQQMHIYLIIKGDISPVPTTGKFKLSVSNTRTIYYISWNGEHTPCHVSGSRLYSLSKQLHDRGFSCDDLRMMMNTFMMDFKRKGKHKILSLYCLVKNLNRFL